MCRGPFPGPASRFAQTENGPGTITGVPLMFVSTARWALVLMTVGVVDCVGRAPHQVSSRSSEGRRADSRKQGKDAIRFQWDCVLEVLESRLDMPKSRQVSKLTLLKQDSQNYRLHAAWGRKHERMFYRRGEIFIVVWRDLRKYRDIHAAGWEDILARWNA